MKIREVVENIFLLILTHHQHLLCCDYSASAAAIQDLLENNPLIALMLHVLQVEHIGHFWDRKSNCDFLFE